MRIILKIIAAPAVLALTLIVAVLNFSVSLASWVLGILSLVLAVCGLFELFIQSNPQWGITGLMLAFLLSPFGLPAAAEWLVCKLDDLTYSLKKQLKEEFLSYDLNIFYLCSECRESNEDNNKF